MVENHRIITRGELPQGKLQRYCCLCGHALFQGDEECAGCKTIIRRTANPDIDNFGDIAYTEKTREERMQAYDNDMVHAQAVKIRTLEKLCEVLRHEAEMYRKQLTGMCSSCGAVPRCLCGIR